MIFWIVVIGGICFATGFIAGLITALRLPPTY